MKTENRKKVTVIVFIQHLFQTMKDETNLFSTMYYLFDVIAEHAKTMTKDKKIKNKIITKQKKFESKFSKQHLTYVLINENTFMLIEKELLKFCKFINKTFKNKKIFKLCTFEDDHITGTNTDKRFVEDVDKSLKRIIEQAGLTKDKKNKPEKDRSLDPVARYRLNLDENGVPVKDAPVNDNLVELQKTSSEYIQSLQDLLIIKRYENQKNKLYICGFYFYSVVSMLYFEYLGFLNLLSLTAGVLIFRSVIHKWQKFGDPFILFVVNFLTYALAIVHVINNYDYIKHESLKYINVSKPSQFFFGDLLKLPKLQHSEHFQNLNKIFTGSFSALLSFPSLWTLGPYTVKYITEKKKKLIQLIN